ncbi:MAG TPA: 30S ribosomal protein S2 [Patescibacteria group bacterium]|nr:30S ribosomal protein S2 [Patescibacteria group bacterium]
MPELPSLEEMLNAGMHFGHRTSNWHPKMEPYIFTSRKGVHIIDLNASQERLKIALEFLQKIASEGKVILFVGTKNQVKSPLKQVAQELGMPYVSEKWIGGLLTNFPVVKKSIKKYNDLIQERDTGKLDKYTKKEKMHFEKEIDKMEAKFGGISELKKMPDALFVWDIKKEKIAVDEANQKNIPVVGTCDTDVNPELVNYPIPSNDDATKTIKMLLNLVKESIKESQNNK